MCPVSVGGLGIHSSLAATKSESEIEFASREIHPKGVKIMRAANLGQI